MSIKIIPEPAKAVAATDTPTIAMRRELHILMYEVAKEHRDEAIKVTGKDQAEEIKSYFSLLGCMSEDMYGMKELDTFCAVEAVTAYYRDDANEERLTELIDQFVQAYG